MGNRIFFICFIACCQLPAASCFSQWSSSPFEHHVFMENKGQFDKIEGVNEKIFYQAVSGGVTIYFSKRGVEYCYDKLIPGKEEAREGKKEEEKEMELEHHVVAMEWIGRSSSVEILPEEKVSFYYTYSFDPKKEKEGIKASAFKKITYRNIYPHIDAEYIIPEKGGVKYSLVVRPGGNVNDIKMKWSEKSLLNESGNVIVKSSFGDFVDHAPVTNYVSGEKIVSAFELTGNIISFKLQTSNLKPETFIIDPWTSSPTFTYNRAFDVNYDLAGNVYALGNVPPPGAFQLVKFNSGGALQWVFNSTATSTFGNYSDFTVNVNTGDSYIGQGLNNANGANVAKVSTAGVQTALFPGYSGWMAEIWRMDFDYCNNKVVAAGGGVPTPSNQALLLDPSLTTYTPAQVVATGGKGDVDIALLTIDKYSPFAYMLIAQSYGLAPPIPFDNHLVKCPLATFSPAAWEIPSGHKFKEIGQNYYTIQDATGFNGIAASPNFLYTYDGGLIKKWNKANGAFISSLNLSATFFNWGGLDVDACDTLYVGFQNTIRVYNGANWALIRTYTMQNTVYDLKLSPSKLYSCGIGFVSQIELGTSSAISLTTTQPTGCLACNGTASVTPLPCLGPIMNYQWAPGGQTTQTVTGLCPGNYTVTVSLNCVPLFQQTFSLLGSGSFSVTPTQTDPVCAGQCIGTAGVTISGSSAPYTYAWSNLETTSSISGLCAGNYSVSITDASSCVSTEVFSITEPPAITSTVSTTPASCGSNSGTASVSTSGGTSPYTYLWNPSAAVTATATGLQTGNYSVTITDTQGCTKNDVASVPSTGTVSATANPSTICAGQTSTLSASGGTNYLWNTGETTSFIVSTASVTTTYTAIVSIGTCADTTYATLYVNPLPVASAGNDQTLCIGSTFTITASGGGTYLWNTGQTTAVITTTPTSSSSYYYSVLVTDANGCTNNDGVTIFVVPTIIANVGPDQTICAGSAAQLVASGGATYNWTPATTLNNPNIYNPIASPPGTVTYSVVVTSGSCIPADTSVTVVVNPVPAAIVATSNVTITAGQSVTLTAGGGETYLWSTGDTGNVIMANPMTTTIYCVTVTDSNTCIDTACVTVWIEPVNCAPVSADDAFVLPSAFSPNKDGQNDQWRLLYVPLLGDCLAEFQVMVYNRWGEKVFEGLDINFSWDGTYKGKMEETAVFGYYISGTLKDGTKIKKKGDVTLLR